MTQIISKRKFRFQNPDVDLMRTGMGGPNSMKYDQAVFETSGTGEIQQAPDWIKEKLGPRRRQNEGDPPVDGFFIGFGSKNQITTSGFKHFSITV